VCSFDISGGAGKPENCVAWTAAMRNPKNQMPLNRGGFRLEAEK
jgi:hypothetical protein